MANTSRWASVFGSSKSSAQVGRESVTSFESLDEDIFDFNKRAVDDDVRRKRRRIIIAVVVIIALLAVAGGVAAGVVLGTRSSNSKPAAADELELLPITTETETVAVAPSPSRMEPCKQPDMRCVYTTHTQQ
jgi:hypothetical protein